MIVKNKIEKPFGPSGTTTGQVLFIGGIVYTFYSLFTYFSLVGIIMIVFGAFIGLTRVCTFIDIEKRKVKFSNVLFGIFPTGKWIEINDGMTLGLEKSRRGFRTYSRGMRTNDNIIIDIRIILYGPDKKKLGPIKKYSSYESAEADLKKYCKTFKVETHSTHSSGHGL